MCEVSYFHVIRHCLLTMLTMLRWKGEDLDAGGVQEEFNILEIRRKARPVVLFRCSLPLKVH